MEPAKSQIEAPLAPQSGGTDDIALVAAILRKDRKATAAFVSLHADAVYGYLRHRLSPQADLVEDLMQEVFLAAWRNLGQFRGASSLRSWLLGIARHKVEDYYRNRLREPEAFDVKEGQAHLEPALTPQWDQFLDHERLEKKTRQVLESLPESYNIVLLWRYWEKRTVHEIAVQTGKTEKAIERLLARAREQFKRRWNYDEPNPG